MSGEALLDEPGFWAYHLHSSAEDVAALEVVLVVYRTDSMLTLDSGCVVTPDEESMVDLWLAPGDGGPGMTSAHLRHNHRTLRLDHVALSRAISSRA